MPESAALRGKIARKAPEIDREYAGIAVGATL
jgi:hypothetical protein